MKKSYVKPQVFYEDFRLSASIATGCELISHHSDETCPVYDPATKFTTYTEGQCDYTPAPGDTKFCYHLPQDTYNVFTSA